MEGLDSLMLLVNVSRLVDDAYNNSDNVYDGSDTPSIDTSAKVFAALSLKRKQHDFGVEMPVSKMRKVDSNDSLASIRSFATDNSAGLDSIAPPSYPLSENDDGGEIDYDDDDDDDDVTSESKQRRFSDKNSGGKRSKEEAKLLHRAIERKRTQRITEAISVLKEELKSQMRFMCKDSKSEILLASIQHAVDLQNEIIRASNPIHDNNLVSPPTMTVSLASDANCFDDYADAASSLASYAGASKEDKRKALHRAVERRRTNRINEHINLMKTMLMSASNSSINDKSNKSLILGGFLSYLQNLTAQLQAIPDSAQRFFVPKKFNDISGKFEDLNAEGDDVATTSRSKFAKSSKGRSTRQVAKARVSIDSDSFSPTLSSSSGGLVSDMMLVES